ncbi:DUF3108 domain-containing protein [Candidatus Aerophobetes bacterium]|nr:DUF3108 domain-containing protein [Candidatus Aerophobetes bacterium]
MKKRLFFLFFLIFFLHSCSIAFSFEKGEKLYYIIKFLGIPAGKQVLEIKEEISNQNRNLYHLSSRITSTGLFSILVNINYKIESYVDKNTLFPEFVRMIFKEDSRALRDIEAKIWQEKSTVKARVLDKIKNRKREKELSCFPLDLLSLIYWLRSQELEVGKKFEILLFDTPGSFKEIQVEVKDVQNAYTYLGVFPAFVCRQVGREVNVEVWFSQDENHIPLYIQTQTSFGGVRAILQKVEN